MTLNICEASSRSLSFCAQVVRPAPRPQLKIAIFMMFAVVVIVEGDDDDVVCCSGGLETLPVAEELLHQLVAARASDRGTGQQRERRPHWRERLSLALIGEPLAAGWWLGLSWSADVCESVFIVCVVRV